MPGFPVQGVAGAVLGGLLLLWAALLGFGLLFGKPDLTRRIRLPLPVRMGLSLTLLVAALVWWLAGTADTALATFGVLIFLGMAMSFVGDVFMTGAIVPKPRHVIFGLPAFGAGHVCYILAFVSAAAALGLQPGRTQWIVLGAFWLAALALWLLLVRNPERGAGLNVATLAYSLVLTTMAAMTFMLARQDAGFWLLALGGLLFVVSDLVLGNEIMRRTHFAGIGDLIWITYTVAQMLIVYSSAPALQALRNVG